YHWRSTPFQEVPAMSRISRGSSPENRHRMRALFRSSPQPLLLPSLVSRPVRFCFCPGFLLMMTPLLVASGAKYVLEAPLLLDPLPQVPERQHDARVR